MPWGLVPDCQILKTIIIMTERFDIIIVGGGLLGDTAACILANADIKVALLNAFEPEREWPEDSTDVRVSALTRASQNILQAIDVWPAMVKRGVSPYYQMRVYDGVAHGELHFDSADSEFDQLGHIVENRITIASLWDKLESLPSASIICPVKVKSIQATEKGWRLFQQDGSSYDAGLVIAADGRDSALRSMLGIETSGWPYQQDGLVATVSTQRSHHNTAWQRFLPEGPLAFLPLANGQCSIVWTLATETANEYLQLNDTDFLEALEQASSGILGKMLAVGPRAAFPLRFQYAKKYIDKHFALVGDAAHAMHPLAGQGANAGLLDAATLAELIIAAQKAGRSISSQVLLRRYERWRKGDNLSMMLSLDMLNRIYRNPIDPITKLRSAGMNWIDRNLWIKNMCNRYAMGLREDLPGLAKGGIL